MQSLISVLPLLAVLTPAVGAVLIACTGQRRANLREFWSVAAGIVLAALVICMILVGGNPEYGFPVLTGLADSEFYTGILSDLQFSGFKLALKVDAFGLLFAMGASLLWIVTTFYSIGYMRTLKEHAQTRYFACFALALSATIGVAFSANLFTLFLFYEGLTLVTYPLVAHKETAEAKAGARKYVIYLLGAAKIGVMAAIILTYNGAGTLDFTAGGILKTAQDEPLLLYLIFALFLFGFAKNAVMPMHSWLPAAMVAPTPVSALLHAVAVVKTGVFCTLRVILFVFGPVIMREIGSENLALVVASVTILIGSALALGQDNLKARLAFSTVSQLSYIILGAALLNRNGVTGGIAHISFHAVSKITLFLCAGSIYVSTHKTEISQMSGIARRMPWTMVAFALASLSVIGIPPTCGFVSKWYLVRGTMDRYQELDSADPYSLMLLAVLLISSLLNAAYLGPVVYKAFFEKGSETNEEQVREVPWMVVPLVVTAAASLLLGIFPEPVLSLAETVAEQVFPIVTESVVP